MIQKSSSKNVDEFDCPQKEDIVMMVHRWMLQITIPFWLLCKDIKSTLYFLVSFSFK